MLDRKRAEYRRPGSALRTFKADYKIKEKTIELVDNQGKSRSLLKFDRPNLEHFTLAGSYQGGAIAVKMKRTDESKFMLLSRGFHWVNELPMNRWTIPAPEYFTIT